MVTIYLIDEQSIYVRSIEIDPYAPIPGRGVLEVPPETTGSQVAYWNGKVWEVLAERPSAPVPPPALVPQHCTRRQGRLALLQNGLLDDVEDAIAAITDPAERRAAQIEYEADTWERRNDFLQGMWAQLGGSEQGLDDLFRLAVTL